jgi:hypothetical protein
MSGQVLCPCDILPHMPGQGGSETFVDAIYTFIDNMGSTNLDDADDVARLLSGNRTEVI